jgi:hypothetical protein
VRIGARGTKFSQEKSRSRALCVLCSSEIGEEKEKKGKNVQIGILIVWPSFISKTSDNSDLLHDIDLALAIDHYKRTHKLERKSPMEREADSFSAISLKKHSKHSNTGMYFCRPHLSKNCSFLVGPNTSTYRSNSMNWD